MMRENLKRVVGVGRLATALVLLASLALGAGCSRIHRETMPFGKTTERVDTLENVGRINAWPLFYRRGQSASILWPLIQKSETGNLVAPIYKYEYNPSDLEMGLGILADLEFDKDKYRIVNTVVSMREGNKWLTFLPVYYQSFEDSPTLLLLPLFYWDEGDPDTFISLPFSTGDDFVNFCGLLFHHEFSESQKQTIAAAGLFYSKTKTDGSLRQNHLLPFWVYKREGQADDPKAKTINIGAILYHSSKNVKNNESYQSVLWPVAHRWKSSDGSATALAPLYFHGAKENGDFMTLSLPYCAWREDDEAYRTVGGLYHGWENKKSNGHALFPFFSLKRTSAGGLSFNSLLYNQRRSENSNMTNIGGPIFIASNEKGEKYRAAFWPLFQQWRAEGKSADLVLPLFFRSREGDESFLNVLGVLLNRWASPNKQVTITPLGGWGAMPKQDKGFINVLGLLFHRGWEKDDNLTILGALGGWWKKRNASGSWLFPLYLLGRERDRTTFLSLPFSFSKKQDDIDDWINFGGLLAHYVREGEERTGLLLGALAGFHTDKSTKSWAYWLFPLLGVDEKGFLSIPAYYWNDIPSAEELAKTEKEAREEAKKGEVFYTSYTKKWGIPILLSSKKTISFHGNRVNKEKVEIPKHFPQVDHEFDIPLLYESRERENEYKNSSVLFGTLWRGRTDWVEKDGEVSKNVNRRVLLKGYDYERAGDAVTVDAFPFLSFDKNDAKQYKHAAFLGPLLSRTQKGDQKQWSVFGFKIGDDIALKETK